MADDESLTKDEARMWAYIQKHDLEEEPWHTPRVARDLDMEEQQVYETLSGLAKKLKAEMYIYYNEGAIRVAKNEELLKRK